MKIIPKWLAHPPHRTVLYLLLGGLLFRGIVAFFLFPGFDEAYYYLYTQHLDWSYFDHPLLVALTTGVGPWSLGAISQFTLRLGALLIHTGSLILLYLTAARLFSSDAARLTLAIATIAPLFALGFGSLTSPDNMLIFAWTATLFWAACEFFPSQSGTSSADSGASLPSVSYRPTYRLAAFGVLIGLACLSKYHGFILALSLVGFCLTSRRYRCALISPWMALAFGLFVITLFPLWYWNLNHDWISFRFHLSMRFDGGNDQGGYSAFGMLVAFLAGVGYLFPTLGFPLWWVSGRALLAQLKAAFGHSQTGDDPGFRQKQALILWVSLPIMVGFTVLGGFQAIYPAWPAPGFWSMTLLLGERAVHWRLRSRRWVQRWLVGSGLIVATLLSIALLHITTGTFQKPSDYALLGGFIPPQQDGSTSLIDVGQLRRRLADSSEVNAALQEVDFIFSNEVFLTSYLDMAIRPLTQLPVVCFSADPRGFALWFDPAQFVGQDALYLTPETLHSTPESAEDFRAYFASLEEIETVSLERGGAVTATFHIYRARTMVKPYVYPYP
ncbi:MAG: glycosyltransferase family 39 protein [Leptolyngbyaceae cyanobacterium MO_188.B28]|nr:glycosyltransferase family 39 protein [Leptolyngbyaceae cyanobacterium MO_188.B28]